MKSMAGVPGFAVAALLVSASGAEAQAPWAEATLFGADPGDPVFALLPPPARAGPLSRSTFGEQGPVRSGYAPGPLPIRRERGSWSRILVGAGIGLLVRFGIGWAVDVPEDCPVGHPAPGGDCDLGFYESGYFWHTTLAPAGAALGGLVGWWSGSPRDRAGE